MNGFYYWESSRQEWMHTQAAIADMRSPVRCCHCHRIYDLGRVEIVGHYTDCSMWRCPGCHILCDDRQDYFRIGSGVRHYERLEKEEGPWQQLVEMGY